MRNYLKKGVIQMEYKIIGKVRHASEVRRFFKNLGSGYRDYVYEKTLDLDLDDVQKTEFKSGYVVQVENKYGIAKREKTHHKYYLSLMFDRPVVDTLISLKFIVPYQNYTLTTTRNDEKIYCFGSLEYAQRFASQNWRGYISKNDKVLIYDEEEHLVSSIEYLN